MSRRHCSEKSKLGLSITRIQVTNNMKIIAITAFCIMLVNSVILCAKANNCECENIDCANMNTDAPNCQHGRILDRCGCCFVCLRKIGEICGGENENFGKCETTLICIIDKTNPANKLKKGVCTGLRNDVASESDACDNRRKNYFDRKISNQGIYHCYENVCGRQRRVRSINLDCLDIGCGVTRPLLAYHGSCCNLCIPEKVRVHCDSGVMQVIVPKSFMSRKVFQASSLINKKCTGVEINKHYVFETSIHSCGTNRTHRNGRSYTYSNQIKTTAQNGLGVQRMVFNFFCTFERSMSTTAIYKVRQDSIVSGGTGVRMLFTRGGRLLSDRRRIITSKEKRLDVTISSRVARRYKLRLETKSCYLSSSKGVTTKTGREHFFIQDGCIVDDRVKLRFKRGDAIWFSFTTNDLKDKFNGRMYLHCDLIICSKQSIDALCKRECSSKKY